MIRTVHLRAVHDPDADVFVVTGEDYRGLTFEADTMEHALERAKVIVPDLMDANGEAIGGLSIVVTEYRLTPHRELTAEIAA